MVAVLVIVVRPAASILAFLACRAVAVSTALVVSRPAPVVSALLRGRAVFVAPAFLALAADIVTTLPTKMIETAFRRRAVGVLPAGLPATEIASAEMVRPAVIIRSAGLQIGFGDLFPNSAAAIEDRERCDEGGDQR